MVSHMLFPRKYCNTASLPRWASLHLLLALFLSANTVYSGSIVKYLPGFDGELPFKLETGYISVGDSELFYYFIESQGNPQQDPLFLWLTGGPGCSSFSGLVYEIGPLEFQINNYTGGLPRLVYYPYAWTKTASIIFLDAPVGTGFSYARTPEGWPTSDSESSEQSYQFLRKWLDEHPKYLPVQLFIGGDSYSGIIVPLVTKKVIDGIAAEVKPRMNLKGYLIGSPRTDSVIDENSKIIFAHRMALISDELYEELKISCQGNYVDVDPSNTACVLALAYYKKCIKDLFRNDILEPKCAFASPSLNTELDRRSVQENSADFILSPPRIHEYWCRNFNYALAYMWSNDDRVQDALHVRQGFVWDWKRCNKSLSYTNDILSVVDVHRYLSKKGLQVLVESGDRDMVVPFVGTEQWIKSLNLTIVNDWRPWLVDGQIAGYTRKYSENGFRLTFATVKGAGHTAPEYYRRECYNMFQRWITPREPPGRNVVLTVGALHQVDSAALRSAASAWHDELAPLPKPLLVVNVGGPTSNCPYGVDLAKQLATMLRNILWSCGSIRISFSRRTPEKVSNILVREFSGNQKVYIWDGEDRNPHMGHLAWADAFVITADSVSMLSEACSTGKPVYVIGAERCTWKFADFQKSLQEQGVARPLTGKEDISESWSYSPLNDTTEAANRVNMALAQRGWSIHR